ncbi:MAG: lipid A deacylase LpxR family protein, partial [Deltaproteobacteria bacterium]|nr:lipid A deacylase LpxR family protein [Deltaproteobacteria bacterium]
MHTKPLCIFFLCCMFTLPCQAFAADDIARHMNTVTLYMENDLFYNTDRQYTHGLKLSWISPDLTDYRDIIADDRPYAGMTYIAIGFHGKNTRQMDTLELDVGIIGRHSYADDCQRAIHNWIDVTDPKGWEHQLRDEPIFNAFFERKWRLLRAKYRGDFSSDFIPHIGGGAGNAFT